MSDFFLEICVDSLESARRAAAQGADRIELCANLLLGGTTPSPTLIRQAVRTLPCPVNVLLRPRFGDFRYTPEEQEEILDAIDLCADLGASGVVLGALTPEGDLDEAFLSRCLSRRGAMSATLHRCFDVCRDPFQALEQAIQLGFDTILTSGQQSSAPQGAALLAQLNARAAGRVLLMAGSGVTPGNIPQLYAATGLRYYHFSGKHTEPGPMVFRRPGVPMGLPMASEFDRQYADPAAIAQARRVLDTLT